MRVERLFLCLSGLLLAFIACNLPMVVSNTKITSSKTPTLTLPALLLVVTPTKTVIPMLITGKTNTPDPSDTQSAKTSNGNVNTTNGNAGQHVVVSGETLSCIGRAYGVLPSAIADANGIMLTTVLKTGQILNIPFVQWMNIPSGPVCQPQFTPPYAGASGPAPLVKPTLPLYDTAVPTKVPRHSTDVPPTDVPPTDVPPTDVPPTAMPPNTAPPDTPTPGTAGTSVPKGT
jgi:LysM repeat protein